jgi:hypothetical protein
MTETLTRAGPAKQSDYCAEIGLRGPGLNLRSDWKRCLVAVLEQREVGRWCRKGHLSRGTPISYPGLAGRQLAAGTGGHVPAHRITALFEV